jgi:hypothetical protein
MNENILPSHFALTYTCAKKPKRPCSWFLLYKKESEWKIVLVTMGTICHDVPDAADEDVTTTDLRHIRYYISTMYFRILRYSN